MGKLTQKNSELVTPSHSRLHFQGAHQVRHSGVHRSLELQPGRLSGHGAVEAVDLAGTTRQEVLVLGSPEMLGK